MDELIIGKTYSMIDSRNGAKYIYEIHDKQKNYHKVKDRYNSISYMIDISLYSNIEEIENKITTPDYYGGKDNPFEPRKITKHYKLTPNLANVLKYVVRAGVKVPTIKGKIDDLQKAINYLRFEIEDLMEEIENLEKEKNNG